ncbi:hypothetical protein MKA31_13385 [[Clostridium] innocuum]|nr:hypothetical protein [[Clostridium] innocuum]MCR0273076.1 hypothetical protein [[Clostridium] innocuum]MCR0394250.1 hypothetical protein [[Clostridium] innocuum]
MKDCGTYLSPAPQAEPQAVGVSSVLSPAPQAEPQAVGVSLGSSPPAPQAEPQAVGVSLGSSPPAPQAEPQAEDTPLLFHANKLDNAMMNYLLFIFREICFSVLYILLI